VNTFLGKLHSFIEEPLELVLYLGAGSFADLPKSRALTIKHLVLVEGDPHLAGQIARSLGNEISSQVLPVLLTPHGAKTTFYRYNLPFLNGVLPLGDLQSLYPRLKVVEELELASTTLSALFQTIPLAGEGKRLLIMDIPGQETAILESVNPQQLQGFDWILLRGCRAALQQGAQPLAMGIARLEGSLFEKVYRDEESDPDWPVGLLHLDRRKVDFNHEMERSLRRLGEMTHASQEQARRIAEVESQLKSSLSELDDARTQLGELNTRIVVMEEAKALALREAADREAAVQAELGNRTRLLEEKAAESQQRAQRVAEFELQLRSSQSELDDARRQLGELNQKIAEMAETKAQALKEAADREAAVQSELTHRIWLLDVKVSENRELQNSMRKSPTTPACLRNVQQIFVRQMNACLRWNLRRQPTRRWLRCSARGARNKTSFTKSFHKKRMAFARRSRGSIAVSSSWRRWWRAKRLMKTFWI
jgi:hypothetical protein